MTKKYLFNPLKVDIIEKYDNQVFTLPSQKLSDGFDDKHESAFIHMRDVLVTLILNERNEWHFDANREEVRKEIVRNI